MRIVRVSISEKALKGNELQLIIYIIKNNNTHHHHDENNRTKTISTKAFSNEEWLSLCPKEEVMPA